MQSRLFKIFAIIYLSGLAYVTKADSITDFCIDKHASDYSACVAEQVKYKEQFYGANFLAGKLKPELTSDYVIKKCPSLLEGNYSLAYFCLVNLVTNK